MVTAEAFRRRLGSKGENLSEEEIAKRMELCGELARVLFRNWIKESPETTTSPASEQTVA